MRAARGPPASSVLGSLIEDRRRGTSPGAPPGARPRQISTDTDYDLGSLFHRRLKILLKLLTWV